MMVNEPGKQPTPETSGGGLSELLGLGLGVKQPWQPEELRLALEEQLAVPVEFELSALDRQVAHQLRLRAKREGLLLRSLGELLQHPKPPLDLLVMAKDFFKRNRDHPQSDLPPDVSLALYYTCIAVALWRHRSRISQMNNSELAAAFEWMQAQAWIGKPAKRAATEAARVLAGR